MKLPITILNSKGILANYDLSLGRIEADKAEAVRDLLTDYSQGDLHTITDIIKCQSIISCSGYGISNTVLVSVGQLAED